MHYSLIHMVPPSNHSSISTAHVQFPVIAHEEVIPASTVEANQPLVMTILAVVARELAEWTMYEDPNAGAVTRLISSS